MNIMAVAALDAVVKHFRLNKRTVDVVFVSNLTIGMINGLVDGLQHKELVEVAARRETTVNLGSPRVARSAGVDLSQVTFGL